MLAVFKSAADSTFKAYEKAAGGLWSDYDFAHTFDASLVEEVNRRMLITPAITIYNLKHFMFVLMYGLQCDMAGPELGHFLALMACTCAGQGCAGSAHCQDI